MTKCMTRLMKLAWYVAVPQHLELDQNARVNSGYLDVRIILGHHSISFKLGTVRSRYGTSRALISKRPSICPGNISL